MEELTIILAKRLKKLRQDRDLTIPGLQVALAEKYGMKISKESLTNYEVSDPAHSKYGKNMGMNIDYLRCFADFYNVNTDYLLGRTDVRNTDTDIQSVASYTALSESSIFWLRSCATNGEIQILNALIGHPLFELALCDIFELKNIAPQAIKDASFFIHPHEWKDGCTTINIQTYSELLEFKIIEAFKEAFKYIVYPGGKSPKAIGESWDNNAIHQENDHKGG